MNYKILLTILLNNKSFLNEKKKKKLCKYKKLLLGYNISLLCSEAEESVIFEFQKQNKN